MIRLQTIHNLQILECLSVLTPRDEDWLISGQPRIYRKELTL
jgi:hypothetical protein